MLEAFLKLAAVCSRVKGCWYFIARIQHVRSCWRSVCMCGECCFCKHQWLERVPVVWKHTELWHGAAVAIPVSQPCYMRRVAKLSPIFVHFAHDLSVHPRLFILQLHSAKQKVWTEWTHRSCNSSEYAFKWYQVINLSIGSDTLPNLPSLLALDSMYIADLQSLETVSTNIQGTSMV